MKDKAYQPVEWDAAMGQLSKALRKSSKKALRKAGKSGGVLEGNNPGRVQGGNNPDGGQLARVSSVQTNAENTTEAMRKKAEKRELKRDKKRAKAQRKLIKKSVSKGQALYLLAKSASSGMLSSNVRQALAMRIDRSGPLITGPLAKSLKKLMKGAAASDVDDSVTSIAWAAPYPGTQKRPKLRSAKPKGKLGDLSHVDQGVGAARKIGHRASWQVHPDTAGLSADASESFVMTETTGEPIDDIERAMGVRRLPGTIAHASLGTFAELSNRGNGELDPFDAGTVRRPSYDRAAEQAVHEPDQVGHVPGDTRPHVSDMSVPSADSEGHRMYEFWSHRHARMNRIGASDLYMMAAEAVNSRVITFEESTFVVNRCERGLPIPESLLRRIVDSAGER